ncbi:hypothetical protein M758_2G210300 [Ceratodon purpureus]|nr:hypothetical protein M758_2G210300 [Ceratodon purpureus]
MLPAACGELGELALLVHCEVSVSAVAVVSGSWVTVVAGRAALLPLHSCMPAAISDNRQSSQVPWVSIVPLSVAGIPKQLPNCCLSGRHLSFRISADSVDFSHHVAVILRLRDETNWDLNSLECRSRMCFLTRLSSCFAHSSRTLWRRWRVTQFHIALAEWLHSLCDTV